MLRIVATNSRELIGKICDFRWCAVNLSSQESNPKSVSIGRSIPFYLGQEDVIIIALIETLPLQLRCLNGRASVSNGKRKSHRTSGPGLLRFFFSPFYTSHNALVCEWRLDNACVLVHVFVWVWFDYEHIVIHETASLRVAVTYLTE